MNKEVTLPSGAILKITLSPFAISKALYIAVLEETKGLHIDPEAEVDTNLFKDMFCVGFSSKKIEAALDKCMERALYNGLRITNDTFEPEEAREDYLSVCWEVAYANLLPFTKSLSRQFSAILATLPKLPESK